MDEATGVSTTNDCLYEILDGADVMLMVVNLDPFNTQHGFIQLPLTAWGVTPHSSVEVLDLLSNERYYWRGEWNYVRLDPQASVAHVLHVLTAVSRPLAGATL